MKNIKKEFEKFCKNNLLEFSSVDSIKAYDNSTLFCPAGMQQFSGLFEKKWIKGIVANIQSCLRMDDIENIGDGSHLVCFDMLGIFSFRQFTVKQAMDYWISFLEEYLELRIDKITVHPKKLREWLPMIDEYLMVETDNDCVWTDRNTSGYCMEFYVDGVEVGNIVNTEEDCIDAGFGLERLDTACNGTVYNKKYTIETSIKKIIDLGIDAGNTKQDYVLRKLLNLAVKNNCDIDHPLYKEEKERIDKMQEFYKNNKEKFKGKSKKWWKETHGVEL